MTKKSSSIVKLVIVSIVAILGAVLCFVSWYWPGSFYKVNSFASQIKLGLDLKGGIYAVYEAKSEGVADFEEKLTMTQDRLVELLTAEGYDATITTEGTNNLRVEVPDVDNPSRIFDLIGKPCQVVFVIDDQIVMHGKDKITGATAYLDSQNSGGYAVSLEMTTAGKTEFGEVTANNVNKDMSIYLVYDEDYENFATTGTLVTTATINEAIYGNAQITGSFDAEGASDLATKIESGTFSLTLSLIESSTMPATLGEEALDTGLLAGAIGLLIVVAFLIWRYRLLGVVATISLVVYTELMFFFLAALPWVQLTLAGIAGIILSLGMAVDGNVIIYERMKEEYRDGKSVLASYHAGFSKSRWSIIDGNVTTVFAAIILLILGVGTVQGFGLTLLVGILLSLFTSLLFNKFLVGTFVNLAPENAKLFALSRNETSADNVDEIVADEVLADVETISEAVVDDVVEESNDNVAPEESEGGNE